MSDIIVSKVGGTSVATPEAFERAIEIGMESSVLVTSAPGKLSNDFEGRKVTDQLLDAHTVETKPQEEIDELEYPEKTLDDYLAAIQNRFDALASRSDMQLPSGWISKIPDRVIFAIQHSRDAASMLGEQLMSELFGGVGFDVIDYRTAPAGLGKNLDLWRQWAPTVYKEGRPQAIGGNITRDDNGQNVTFSRGGSDTLAGYFSYGVGAAEHWNWTDGQAKSADPKRVKKGTPLRNVSHILYEELEELGVNGTGLVHHDAGVPLSIGDIPTRVKSTMNPDSGETVVDNDYERAEKRAGQAVALTVLPDVSIVRVYEPGMSSNTGRLSSFNSGISEAGITLIDTEGDGSAAHQFIVGSDNADKVEAIIRDRVVNNGRVESSDPSDIVAVVGYRISDRLGHSIMPLILDSGFDPGKNRQRHVHYAPRSSTHVLRACVDPRDTDEVLGKLHRSFITSCD